MRRNLSMRAGESGALHFTLTAPPDTDTTLVGAMSLRGNRSSIPFELRDPSTLVIPAQEQAGVYCYEVRAGGVLVLHGLLEVLPSPLCVPGCSTAWEVNATLPHTDVVSVTVTLAPGLPGKDGADGKDGKDGATAQEVADAFLAATVVPQTHLTTQETGGNAGFTTARFPAPETGQLHTLALTCRSGGSICPQPLYLVLTTADGHKYVSRVALMQSGGVRLAWQFAEATITRGEMLTLEASYTPDGNTADDAWVGCLGISTASAAEGQCQGTNGQWYNILPVIELGMKVAARPLLLTETQQQKLLTLLQ